MITVDITINEMIAMLVGAAIGLGIFSVIRYLAAQSQYR